ncbi:MAG: peptide chain release factor 3 [Deltaproteobacteria bacterium]|nr:peptide chain release factor 3 [Deltaproteobacteria bacterium]
MTESLDRIRAEVGRRRTFAIISHPDAGKTTLTEKVLLYGGAIHLAGAVKQRRNERHTTSDWMALERERGISVSTSVLQFTYQGHHINLLDTPGHNDFSEDTYRTLAAADCAVMLIDSVKGVEPQTIKLFEVCSMRHIPIVTFVNKMDRAGRDPLELLDEIERVLGIPCVPANWPIGAGQSFQGVYDRKSRALLRFEKAEDVGGKASMSLSSFDDAELRDAIGSVAHQQLVDELALLDGAGNEFDQEQFLRGAITPVFFGSAMNNFGVEPFLDRFVVIAPPPVARATIQGEGVPPVQGGFSGFVFKIQANMDPQHRDRVAFLRVASGRFHKGMSAVHARTGKALTLSRPVQFLAQERFVVEEAFAGDIIGLWDPGVLRIGDTLCQGEPVEYEGVMRFSPEHFVRIRLTDPLKRKQLKKGLEELSEEGGVQVFYDRMRLERDPILGAVGYLQFEVVQYRLRTEYGVQTRFESLPYQYARWVEGDGFDADDFEKLSYGDAMCVLDGEDRPLALFETEWSMRRTVEKFSSLRFVAAVQPGRSSRA